MVQPRGREFSKIKEVVAGWSSVRQFLRGGDAGQIVPVVILKERRRYGWLFLLSLSLYLVGFAVFAGGALAVFAGLVAFVVLVLALLWLWRGAIVEIEQGTTGVLSRYGRIDGTLAPGRHYLWWPWEKVEFVVDTATEIPYLAPVAVCPTQENVPLKA
ncbi:MAG: SPFH domain-containing protein, partial [Rubrobacter sp.]|nr:SPFH domain-containing protein [Rubrobacter sp.]